MKNILRLGYIILAFTASNAFAAGKACWLETSHNFGAFHEDDGKRTCSMRYVNCGDSALTITAARSSCGCTLAEYSRRPLAPGDTAEIVVSYDPTGRPGRFSKNVYINFDNDEGRSVLTISGVVIGAPVTLQQRYPVEAGDAMRMSRGAVMAGDVAKGRTKTVYMELYNASTDTIRPAVVKAPAFTDVRFLPEAVAPGEQTSLVCHVNTARIDTWGLVEDSLIIAPGKGQTPVAVPMTVVVSEDFSRLTDEQRAKAPVISIAPERLDFGTLKRDSGPVKLVAEITNNGRNGLDIRRVQAVDPGISAAVDRRSVKHGRKAVLTVEVDPSLISGKMLNSKIIIISNDPSRPNATLRVVGLVD
ncbi:MAG: DUF1573 domain-containing protein [Muribaculaceae bacterium]|nr:DUF1573 domain-containing protein [Muribaculaceae bacterium]